MAWVPPSPPLETVRHEHVDEPTAVNVVPFPSGTSRFLPSLCGQTSVEDPPIRAPVRVPI